MRNKEERKKIFLFVCSRYANASAYFPLVAAKYNNKEKKRKNNNKKRKNKVYD